MKQDFFRYLENIKLGKVVSSTAGGGAGSIIKIEIENKGILYILFINCTWRIENNNTIIATSADDITAQTGLIAKSAAMLDNKKVISFELSKFNDLFIEFSDDFYIRIFNIFSHSNIDDYNWDFWIPSEDLSYEITNSFDIKKEKYYR